MSRARDNANLSPTIADARMPNLTGDVTTVEGAVATTIATDAVDIAMLSATGTADGDTFLRGDNAWAAAGGGKILQVKAEVGRIIDFDTSSSSYTTITDSDTSITPTSASSRIYVQWSLSVHQGVGTSGANHVGIKAFRDTTDLGVIWGQRGYIAAGGYIDKTTTAFIVDHPNTTSAVSYSLKGASLVGGSMSLHRVWTDTNDPPMHIVAWEIEMTTDHT